MGRGFAWRSLGPGLLFAGAAVGVSHLVQSTRAGAGYALSFVVVVVIANLIKYPAFRFGPQYAAGTGESLLAGYRRQGRWALALYALLTLATMFVVQAAVTLVTAGLAAHLLGGALPVSWIAALLLLVCVGLLAVGGYRWLERVGRVVVVVFAVCTLIATALALPKLRWSGLWPEWGALNRTDLLFAAALVGWMPSAIDVSVWQSLWTLEKRRVDDFRYRATLFDFHVGYVGTAALALCFVVLGAAIMHRADIEVAAQPAAFAGQLVDLYGETLGAWSRPLIALCAFLVMFSTTLTVMDGFPRALTALVGAESDRRVYWSSMLLLAAGSLLILIALVNRLKAMVDLATTLSFLTAPVLAILNHRAMFLEHVRGPARPGRTLAALSIGGIVAQLAFALYYMSLRFSG